MKRNILFTLSAVFLSASMLVACSSTPPNSFEQSSAPSSSLSTSPEAPSGSNTSSILADVSLSDITNFSVLADIGSIEVKQGDEYAIAGENLVQDWISVETQNSELIIHYQPPTPDDVKGINTSSHLFTITLPLEHSLKEATFNAGTGNLKVENLETDKLTVSQGTGILSLSNITVNSFVAECGTGIFDGKNVVVKQTSELHAGMGYITLSGDLSGSIMLEGGTGSTTLNLVQPKENYIVKGESFVREILLDSEPMKYQGDEWEEWEFDENTAWEKDSPSVPVQQPNSNGQHTIQIDGGVGTVFINFLVAQ